ncbi:hypothetical protein [Nocardia yamanashiensis]|uniref:hypothetical protein n=1 Tax=Nocardia yamanashiensis TaxID=209247 RepID=UPI0012FD2D6E|nr:hypothetical protein [Nocardia yamanashiensis]
MNEWECDVFLYRAVCVGDFGETPPLTIFVTKLGTTNALAWNQGIQAWQYDPNRVFAFTSDFNNDDRWKFVEREEAEEFSRQLAVNDSSASELPNEDWIEWFFSWEGDPPEHEDVSWDDDLHVRQMKAERVEREGQD